MRNLLIFLFSIYSLSCLPAQSNPDEVMRSYAISNNIAWIPQNGTLGYEQNDKVDFNQLLSLPEQSLALIKTLGISYLTNKIDRIPSLNLMTSLENLEIEGSGITDITAISNLKIKFLDLSWNSINYEDLKPILNMESLEFIGLNGSLLKSIPDFSGLPKLRSLSLAESSIRSLDGLDVIKEPLVLDISDCPNLVDIDALKDVPLKRLYISEKDYKGKFADWFKDNLDYLKEKNPGFDFRVGYWE